MANKGGTALKPVTLSYSERDHTAAYRGKQQESCHFFVMEVGKTYNKLGDKIFNDEFSNDIHI